MFRPTTDGLSDGERLSTPLNDGMRYSGDWMTLVDDRVLEYLSEHEAGSPAEIREEARISFYSGTHVARRLRALEEEGFVQKIAAPATYRITERGEAYLAGEYDASTHDEEGPETDGGEALAA